MSSDVRAANQAAPALNCDLTQYKASTGLTSALEGNVLTVSWNGQGTSQLRARFAIDGGTPTIRDLSVRRGSGEWAMLGQNLTPEYQVTTGRAAHVERPGERILPVSASTSRPSCSKNISGTPSGMRRSACPGTPRAAAGARRAAVAVRALRARRRRLDRAALLPSRLRRCSRGRAAGLATTRTRTRPASLAAAAFRLPRKPEEIRRGVSAFSASSCEVKSDGASLAVTFPGMKLGIFDGNLRFTVYRGTNLLQMDAIARTNEPSVAYKYDAGLKGFSTATMPRVTWRDTGGHPQQHQFGGPKAMSAFGHSRVQSPARWQKDRAARSRRSRRRTRSSSRAKWM